MKNMLKWSGSKVTVLFLLQISFYTYANLIIYTLFCFLFSSNTDLCSILPTGKRIVESQKKEKKRGGEGVVWGQFVGTEVSLKDKMKWNIFAHQVNTMSASHKG